MPLTVGELAQRFGGEVRGDAGLPVAGVAALDRAGASDLAYCAEARYLPLVETSRAGVVVLRAADAKAVRGTAWLNDNPKLAFARAAALLYRAAFVPVRHASAVVEAGAQVADDVFIGAKAVIERGADIAPGCYIGAGSYVGEGAEIGAHSWLGPNVTVLHGSRLGARCVVHSGAVIGSDGFGFAAHEGQWTKVPQLGRVVIGDDVEIGANTAVDRGALGDTVIGRGAKLDNLIQIAHNVQIGEHTAMAALVGVAGSATVGSRCRIGGQAGIAGHLTVGDDVEVLATSLIAESVPAGQSFSSAIPGMPTKEWRRNAARLRRLDELARRLKTLENKIQQLLEGDKQ